MLTVILTLLCIAAFLYAALTAIEMILDLMLRFTAENMILTSIAVLIVLALGCQIVMVLA